MKFGYLIVVSKNDSVDYLKCAYAAALSIKNTQKPGYDQVALVTDDPFSVKRLNSPWVFDFVIEWNQEQHWDGRSWMDKLSPFSNTVCIDADMLFLRDYSHWIDYLIEHKDLFVANNAYTYRGEKVTGNYYRKAFTKNNIPDLYSMFTFFKKNTDIANEFFSLGRYIIKNPIEFKNLYMSEHNPKVVGTDEAFGLAAKILDITDEIAHDLDFPRVVHMKPMIQNWPWPADSWSDHIGFYLNKTGQLKIGNYQQHDIVHYVEKDKIDDEIINILEELAWKK
jgi:hypothetical protein